MHKSVYCADINAHIKKYIKNCMHLEFQQTQPKEKIIHHDIPLSHGKCLVQMYFTLIIRTIYALQIITVNSH